MTVRIRLHNPTRMWTATVGHGVPEWPPAPWRVVAALLSGAHRLPDDQCVKARGVLARLVESPAPVMWLPDVLQAVLPSTWVPGSVVDEPEKNLHRLLDVPVAMAGADDRRAKKAAPQTRVEWAHPCVWLDVDLAVSADEAGALARAAQRVGYVGRADHPLDVGVLTHDGDRWADHTGRDDADPQLLKPSGAHARWVPVTHGGTPVRCWSENALTVLDADFEQRMLHGQRGLGGESKGRTVQYAPRGGGNQAYRWVGLRLARSVPTVAETIRAVAASRPAVVDREVPVVRHGRLLGLWVDGPTAAARAQQALPGQFSAAVLPYKHNHVGTAQTWCSSTPVAAVAHERAARAVIARDLADYADSNDLQLHQAGVCATRPELSLWHCRWRAAGPVTGPVRAGRERDQGCGVFVTDEPHAPTLGERT